MSELVGQSAFITGGSSGIGKEIAIALAKEGADIIFTYNNNEKSAKQVVDIIESTYNRKADAIKLDLSVAEELHLENILGNDLLLENLSILVNNVGTLTRDSFLDIAPDVLNTVFKVNFFAPFSLTQSMCNILLAKKKRGSIINISSLSARKAVSKVCHYQCSKAALEMLTQGASYEVAEHGIRINSIAPGLISTPANAPQREEHPDIWQQRVNAIPMRTAGTPKSIAEAVVFLVKCEWITGSTITIDGGQSAV